VQLTELLYQHVNGLGAQGLVSLRPGYVAAVAEGPALRHAVAAALFPGLPGERTLSEDPGQHTRVGVGFGADDGGPPYRLLREIGGERQLQRQDPASRKYGLYSKDMLELESFLRLECALPTTEQFAALFVIEANDLPSQRGNALQGPGVDQALARTLRDELDATRRYEDLQDQLFRATEKLRELEELLARLDATQAELQELEGLRAKMAFTPEQQTHLMLLAKRYRTEEKTRDEELSKIGIQRRRLREGGPPAAEHFVKNTLFSGGMAAGVLIDAAAVMLKKPSVALLGLAGFGAALIAVLQWIGRDEESAEAVQEMKDLKDREDRVRKAFNDEMAPLRAALRAGQLEDPADLLKLFEERTALDRRHTAASLKYRELLNDPRLATATAQREELIAEKAGLDTAVAAQGFARPIGEIEAELKAALGLSADSRRAITPDSEVPRQLYARAADALTTLPEPLADALEPRLASYLSALTDRRVVAGRMDANGQLMLSTPDGRWGPYATLPLAMRDLAYLAVRLALVERVSLQKKAPLIVDDALAPLETAKQHLLVRMLKGLSSQVQVLHRCAQPPPTELVDHLVQVP
jgi:hypothetical protein